MHYFETVHCENIQSDLDSLMILSVPYQELSDSLYLNADEKAMRASEWHTDPGGKRLIYMQV